MNFLHDTLFLIPIIVKMLMFIQGFKISLTRLKDVCIKMGNSTALGSGQHKGEVEYRFVMEQVKKLNYNGDLRLFHERDNDSSLPSHVYVCYNWHYMVTAPVNLDEILSKPIPPAFERVRDLLQPDTHIARYAIITNPGWWQPEEETRNLQRLAVCSYSCHHAPSTSC
jgi:hypothetical protein